MNAIEFNVAIANTLGLPVSEEYLIETKHGRVKIKSSVSEYAFRPRILWFFVPPCPPAEVLTGLGADTVAGTWHIQASEIPFMTDDDHKDCLSVLRYRLSNLDYRKPETPAREEKPKLRDLIETVLSEVRAIREEKRAAEMQKIKDQVEATKAKGEAAQEAADRLYQTIAQGYGVFPVELPSGRKVVSKVQDQIVIEDEISQFVPEGLRESLPPGIQIFDHDEAPYKSLIQELKDLRAWKESAMALESTWDEQAVGKLLGLKVGDNIRPAIEPGIRKLIEGQTGLALTDAEKDYLGGVIRQQMELDDDRRAKDILAKLEP